MRLHGSWATLCGALALALAPALVPATTLYMSPGGSDSNTGASAASALKTLKGVLARVAAAKPADAVDVVVGEGTFLGQSVTWTYFNGRPITFAAAAGAKTKPVFDGEGTGLTWFTMADAAASTSASASASPPTTNLRFIGLTVTNYWLALDLGRDKAPGNGGNEVRGMLFERIGAFYTRGQPSAKGFAALRLRRSSNNTIAGNRFHGVKNAASPEDLTGYIHAVYAAHGSRGNVVADNDFSQVTGDAVRTRDGSDGNLVARNRFAAAGKYSAYSDWVADDGDECPSRGNRFQDNTVGDGYFGPFKPGFVTHTYGPDDRCVDGGAPPPPPRIVESGTVVV
ncbi:putative exported protein [Rosellinia necatrix]|uniref:Putative exported protein n=1 Tax=Rosellinia necatrix TaxID=77044 RepID=A0A1S7UJJ3_ROSNE|nr:putative exported protein [Rosellinia necatrix]